MFGSASVCFTSCVIGAEKFIDVKGVAAVLPPGEPGECLLRLRDSGGVTVLKERRVHAAFSTSFAVEAKRRAYFVELDCGPGFEPVIQAVTAIEALTDVRLATPSRRAPR